MDTIIKSSDSILCKEPKIPAGKTKQTGWEEMRKRIKKLRKNSENGGQFPLRIYQYKLIKSQIN